MEEEERWDGEGEGEFVVLCMRGQRDGCEDETIFGSSCIVRGKYAKSSWYIHYILILRSASIGLLLDRIQTLRARPSRRPTNLRSSAPVALSSITRVRTRKRVHGTRGLKKCPYLALFANVALRVWTATKVERAESE